MRASQRKELLERLNALDTGPTEDDRRAERVAQNRKAVQTAEAAGLWGFFGRSAAYR
jgi:hypothetical protein